MNGILANLPVLEATAGGVSGTNTTANSTAPAIPGGIDGYTRTIDMVVAVSILGALLVVGSLVYVCFFSWYRQRSHKKIDEAGDVQVNVTRGGGRR